MKYFGFRWQKLCFDAIDRLYHPFDNDRMDILTTSLGVGNDFEIIELLLNTGCSKEKLTEILSRGGDKKMIYDDDDIKKVLKTKKLFTVTGNPVKGLTRTEFWLMGTPTSLEYTLNIPRMEYRGKMLSSPYVKRDILLSMEEA